jgi:hypothetical protein
MASMSLVTWLITARARLAVLEQRQPLNGEQERRRSCATIGRRSSSDISRNARRSPGGDEDDGAQRHVQDRELVVSIYRRRPRPTPSACLQDVVDDDLERPASSTSASVSPSNEHREGERQPVRSRKSPPSLPLGVTDGAETVDS